MVGLLIAALPFFAYVAERMNRASLMLISFRSEKDALIAELDTAKSMSDEARLRAEEANLAKSRFLASMSHELRTPLNAILGFSEVMGNEVLGPLENPTYRDYARDIHASGRHLLDLINDILDLSRIEAGRMQFSLETFDLAEVLYQSKRADQAMVVAAVEPSARSTPVVPSQACSPELNFKPDGGRERYHRRSPSPTPHYGHVPNQAAASMTASFTPGTRRKASECPWLRPLPQKV